MQEMEGGLLPSGENIRCRLFVLRGLGGIGKTQLAVEFMRRHKDGFSAIFWLDGSSEDILKQSIARQIDRLPDLKSSTIDRARSVANAEGTNMMVKEILDWLAVPGNDSWLLVFD